MPREWRSEPSSGELADFDYGRLRLAGADTLLAQCSPLYGLHCERSRVPARDQRAPGVRGAIGASRLPRLHLWCLRDGDCVTRGWARLEPIRGHNNTNWLIPRGIGACGTWKSESGLPPRFARMRAPIRLLPGVYSTSCHLPGPKRAFESPIRLGELLPLPGPNSSIPGARGCVGRARPPGIERRRPPVGMP